MRSTYISVTREQLYELVWSTPMVQLAPRFGISNVALQRQCKSLNIPTPPLGYWARLSNGYPVEQPPLGPATPGLNILTFKHMEPRKDTIGAIRDAVAAARSFERVAANRVVVHKGATGLHPLLAGLDALLSESTASDKFASVGICVEPRYRDRALLLLDTVLKACDHRKITLGEPDSRHQGIQATIFGQACRMLIVALEHSILNRVPPAALRIEVTVGARTRPCRTFNDTFKARLEHRLNHVVAGLVAIAGHYAETRAAQEQRFKDTWQEAFGQTRLRRSEARRRALSRLLDKLADRQDRARKLGALIFEVERMFDNAEMSKREIRRLDKWLASARGVYEELDSLGGGASRFVAEWRAESAVQFEALRIKLRIPPQEETSFYQWSVRQRSSDEF